MRLNITSKTGLSGDTVVRLDGVQFNDCHRIELDVDVNEGLPRATLHAFVIESRPTSALPSDDDADALAVDVEARIRYIVRHMRLFDSGTSVERTFTIEPQVDGSWLVRSRPDSVRTTERESLDANVEAHPKT